jgi:hypothetical protein
MFAQVTKMQVGFMTTVSISKLVVRRTSAFGTRQTVVHGMYTV